MILGIHEILSLQEALQFYCIIEAINCQSCFKDIELWQDENVPFGWSFNGFRSSIFEENGVKLDLKLIF